MAISILDVSHIVRFIGEHDPLGDNESEIFTMETGIHLRMTRHVAGMLVQTPFMCGLCGCVFALLTDLGSHVSKKHSTLVGEMLKDSTEQSSSKLGIVSGVEQGVDGGDDVAQCSGDSKTQFQLEENDSLLVADEDCSTKSGTDDDDRNTNQDKGDRNSENAFQDSGSPRKSARIAKRDNLIIFKKGGESEVVKKQSATSSNALQLETGPKEKDRKTKVDPKQEGNDVEKSLDTVVFSENINTLGTTAKETAGVSSQFPSSNKTTKDAPSDTAMIMQVVSTIFEEDDQLFEECAKMNDRRRDLNVDNVNSPKESKRLAVATSPMGDKSFQCDVCSESFRDKLILGKHIASAHKDMSQFCQVCHKSYTNNYNLCCTHMKRHTTHIESSKHEAAGKEDKTRKESRKDTDKKVNKSRRLQIPTLIVENRNYPCDLCSSAFGDKYTLGKHRSAVHTGARLPCPMCPKQFKTSSNLCHHMRVHKRYRPSAFICHCCGMEFKQPGGLNMHLKAKHLEEYKSSLTSACDVCGNYFTSDSAMKAHKRLVHVLEKTHACDVCRKVFKTAHYLRIHRTVHTGEKGFCCKVCGRKFARPGTLRTHMKTHSESRPYSCRFCTYRSPSLIGLKIHVVNHADKINLTCSVCNDLFSTRKKLNNHMRIHKHWGSQRSTKGHVTQNNATYQEENPSAKGALCYCDVCYEVFDGHEVLKEHLQRVHSTTAYQIVEINTVQQSPVVSNNVDEYAKVENLNISHDYANTNEVVSATTEIAQEAANRAAFMTENVEHNPRANNTIVIMDTPQNNVEQPLVESEVVPMDFAHQVEISSGDFEDVSEGETQTIVITDATVQEAVISVLETMGT